MFRCNACMALAALLAFFTLAPAGEPAASSKTLVTTAQCERLVKQLVSRYKLPFKDVYVLELPKGVDETKLYQRQKRIKAAYDALSDNIEVSLPVLIKHRDDDRFSYVYEEMAGTSGGYFTESVGGACSKIIADHVEVYRPYTTKLDATYVPSCPSFFYDCARSGQWWKERATKPLAEWQLEACEWVLRQRPPRVFKSQEWAKALKRVEKQAAQLRETNKPILVEHHVQFFSK